MSELVIRKLLKESGAVVLGHFELSSGRHGTTYINKNLAMLRASDLMTIGEEIASAFIRKNIQAVVGPATGAIGLAAATAIALTQRKTASDVLFCYAEREEGLKEFELRRGFAEQLRGKRVLVVEDILTTGDSARRVVEAVRSVGGIVVGFSAIVNRSGITSVDLGHPGDFRPLMSLTLPSYKPENCPECLVGNPLNTDLGHAKKP